jgi:hypothetical protein
MKPQAVNFVEFRGGPLHRRCFFVPPNTLKVFTDGHGSVWTISFPKRVAAFTYERRGDVFELVMEAIAA